MNNEFNYNIYLNESLPVNKMIKTNFKNYRIYKSDENDLYLIDTCGRILTHIFPFLLYLTSMKAYKINEEQVDKIIMKKKKFKGGITFLIMTSIVSARMGANCRKYGMSLSNFLLFFLIFLCIVLTTFYVFYIYKKEQNQLINECGIDINNSIDVIFYSKEHKIKFLKGHIIFYILLCGWFPIGLYMWFNAEKTFAEFLMIFLGVICHITWNLWVLPKKWDFKIKEIGC